MRERMYGMSMLSILATSAAMELMAPHAPVKRRSPYQQPGIHERPRGTYKRADRSKKQHLIKGVRP